MRKLTRAGIAALEGVKHTLRRNPDRVTMPNWLTGTLSAGVEDQRSPLVKDSDTETNFRVVPEGFCRTKGCLAGTLALNAGFKPVYRMLRDSTRTGLAPVLSTVFMAPADGSALKQISDIGNEVLGLTDAETGPFFTDFSRSSDQSEFWEGLNHEIPEDIITAIDRFIEKYS